MPVSDVEVTGVFPSQGNANYTARVAFSFVPSAAVPLAVVRSYKDKAGEWQDARTAEIDGPQRVRVLSSFLKISPKKGTYYLQVEGLAIPYEVTQEVIRQAVEQIDKPQASTAPASNQPRQQSRR